LGGWKSCLPVAACIVAVLALLIVLVPWLDKRFHEASLRAKIASVRADNTGRIMPLDPAILEGLLQDAECTNKVTEVWIIGDFTPNVSDERFRLLKQLPHLRIIRLEYVGSVDALLENIQGMPSLEDLAFHRAGVSEKGMRRVTGFPNLKRLSMDGRTDVACLDALKGHTGIESLGLYEYEIRADRLGFLKTLPNLRELSLELELVGGAALNLRGLPKLQKLSLDGSLATDAALASLEEMGDLTDLDLSGDKITDAGLAHLRHHRKLKRLRLMWQPITDAGLLQLTTLTGLENLDLCKTRITDAGLKHLKGLTALRKLNLSFTQVTDQGVRDLRQNLPNCEIERIERQPPQPAQ
jgi:internalin A